jgi:anti-sigma regulatory factor (Ser/Thr protein kinase)
VFALPLTCCYGPDATSVAKARHAIAEWIGADDPALRVDAQLVVSELVTNALRHGDGAIELHACRDESGLRIEVLDAGDGAPRQRSPGADGGWGLRIVEQVAVSWGGVRGRVWCVLRTG